MRASVFKQNETKRNYFEEVYWKELVLEIWSSELFSALCVQCDAGKSNPCLHPALRRLTHTSDRWRKKAETFEGSASSRADPVGWNSSVFFFFIPRVHIHGHIPPWKPTAASTNNAAWLIIDRRQYPSTAFHSYILPGYL